MLWLLLLLSRLPLHELQWQLMKENKPRQLRSPRFVVSNLVLLPCWSLSAKCLAVSFIFGYVFDCGFLLLVSSFILYTVWSSVRQKSGLVISSTVSLFLGVCSTIVVCRWSLVRLFLMFSRVFDRCCFPLVVSSTSPYVGLCVCP